MGSLSIDRATVGYDLQNVNNAASKLANDVFKESANVLKREAPNLKAEINRIWVGKSAEAFKNKIDRDTEVIINDLNSLEESFRSQFNIIMQNYNNADANVAAAILGEDYEPAPTSLGIYNKLNFATGNLVDGFSNILINNINNKIDASVAVTETALRTGATIVNIEYALGEGLVSLVEKLGDGLLVIESSVVTAGMYVHPGVFVSEIGKTIILDDYKFYSDVNKTADTLWRDVTMPAVSYEWTKKMFDDAYEYMPVKFAEELAYSPFKRDGGLGYKITKGVGEVAGTAVVGACTGGSSVLVTTAMQGVAGIGSSAASNFKNLDSDATGGQIAMAVGNAALNGGIDAAAWYLTYGGGKVTNVHLPNSKLTLGKASISHIAGTEGSKGIAASVFNNTLGNLSLGTIAKAGVQTAKNYGKEATSIMIDGKMDWGKAKEGAITDSVVAVVYDGTLSKPISNFATTISNKIDKVYNANVNTKGVSSLETEAMKADAGVDVEAQPTGMGVNLKSNVKDGIGKIGGKTIKSIYKKVPEILNTATEKQKN